MRFLRTYNKFINESNLVANGPGQQLQDFLDDNLESFALAMADDGYQLIELKYMTADYIFYSLDIKNEIPSPEEFEKNVIENIDYNRRNGSHSNGVDYDGRIGLLLHKYIKYDQLGLKKRLTVKERLNQVTLAYRKLDRQSESIIKRFIKYSPDYEYQKSSYKDVDGDVHLEYYIWPIAQRNYRNKK